MKIKNDDLRSEISNFQKRVENCKTISDLKKLGREIKEKYKITDIQALSILNKRSDFEKVVEEIEKKIFDDNTIINFKI